MSPSFGKHLEDIPAAVKKNGTGNPFYSFIRDPHVWYPRSYRKRRTANNTTWRLIVAVLFCRSSSELFCSILFLCKSGRTAELCVRFGNNDLALEFQTTYLHIYILKSYLNLATTCGPGNASAHFERGLS